MYDETRCDSNFGAHEFLKPLQGIDLGNKNKKCGITLKNVSYEGEYKCKFQRCNSEENNTCKTKVSADVLMFFASITVEVKFPNSA